MLDVLGAGRFIRADAPPSPSEFDMTDRISLLQNLLAKAKRLGAEAADAVVFGSVSSSVSYRLGKLEEVERS